MPNGQWEPSPTAAGYASDLAVIATPTHFDALLANYTGFMGYKSPQFVKSGKYDTVDGIKNLFQSVGLEASASVVTGIDKVTLGAVLSNAISPIDQASLKNYDVTDNRMIFLVLGAQSGFPNVDGLGVLYIEWRLTINDYKKKV